MELPFALSNAVAIVSNEGLSAGSDKEAVIVLGGGTDRDVVDGVWLLDLVAGKWWQVCLLALRFVRARERRSVGARAHTGVWCARVRARVICLWARCINARRR